MLQHIWASEEVENPLNFLHIYVFFLLNVCFIIMYAKKLSRNYLYLTTCAPEGKH